VNARVQNEEVRVSKCSHVYYIYQEDNTDQVVCVGYIMKT